MKGEPFIDAAGQLLDNLLRRLKLTREEPPPARLVYIANPLMCRLPRNHNPEPDDLAQCEPFLLRQIELVRPRLNLAMGRLAVQSLMRRCEPIGQLRGRVHRQQGVPLVASYRPADKVLAGDDLCLSAQTAE